MKKILLIGTAALLLAACGEKKPSEQVLETRDKAVKQTKDAIDARKKPMKKNCVKPKARPANKFVLVSVFPFRLPCFRQPENM